MRAHALLHRQLARLLLLALIRKFLKQGHAHDNATKAHPLQPPVEPRVEPPACRRQEGVRQGGHGSQSGVGGWGKRVGELDLCLC